MRLSRYTIDVEASGHTYCYNLLNGNYVYKNRLYENSSFFVEDSRDEFIEINSYNKTLRENSSFIRLALKITQDCNFKCDYCFEQHEKIYLDMSAIEKLCHIIKSYIIHHKNINRIVVIWFGGEPLLHIKYMFAATESLKNSPLKWIFNTQTYVSMVWAGLGAGCAALVVIYILIRFMSVRLPLKPFFMGTSVVLSLMAVSFIGTGVKNLQTANVVGVTLVSGMASFDLLGVYPTVETLIPQGVLLAALAATFALHIRKRKMKDEDKQ